MLSWHIHMCNMWMGMWEHGNTILHAHMHAHMPPHAHMPVHGRYCSILANGASQTALGCAAVIDFWFYWTHRALHWPTLYRRVHKIHHRYKAPVAAVAVYAHPLEFLVGNVAGVLLGPVLSNCHPYTAYLWVATSLVSTCGAHSGYTFFSAQKHDDHHQFFNWNFGVGPMCDVLFGSQMDTPGVRPKTAPVVNSFGGLLSAEVGV